MKLSAPTEGYAPGAWFIQDSPLRKAIFMTRCGGSSGDCLFYLDWKNRSLKNISDDLFLIDGPVIEDVDGDGISEIFVTAPDVGARRRAAPLEGWHLPCLVADLETSIRDLRTIGGCWR